MKKAIKAIFLSIFTVCLNINYATAVPSPAIKEFVTPSDPNQIYQVSNSKWCVPTCTDIASVYISRISGADLTDVSVQSGILVNGVVFNHLANWDLNIGNQFEVIRVGADIIPFINSAPMERIKDLVYNNGDRTAILPYDDYKRSGKPCEFLKNALYRRPVGERRNWKCNNNVCVIISEYLHRELTAFTDKDTEEGVNETLDQFVNSLQESDLRQIYSLNKAIPCLLWSLNLLGVEGELNRWFHNGDLATKIGNIRCECQQKDVPRQADNEVNKTTREHCFEDIITNINSNNLVILEFVYDTVSSRGNHACIVAGVNPVDSTEKWLEVYNPDPSYSGTNPMKVDKSLTYIAPGNKTKVVSRYIIVKYQK